MELKNPTWIWHRLEEQASVPPCRARHSVVGKPTTPVQQEERLVARLGKLDDHMPVILRVNNFSAGRKSIAAELDDLLLL
jgi:CO dehydrogenase/acetyl-CoA synthase gamma subunit (corrinoid Fe-S protein)